MCALSRLTLFMGLCIIPMYTHMALQLSVDDLYSSPCPEIFNYFIEDGVLQYGIVKVDVPDQTVIQLQVELSVGNHVQGYNGDLVLATSRDETIQNILHRRPITYRLNYPRWYNYPPKVTKILLNGQLICQGPPIDIKTVRILTTINLHHTLKLRLDPSFPDIGFNPQPPEPAITSPPITTYSMPPIVLSTMAPQTFPPPTFPPQIIPDPSPPVLPDRGGFGITNDQCGIPFNTNTLIAHGRDVLQGQYPWLTAIFIVKSLGLDFLCGASLISHRHILTAGHCMKQGSAVVTPDKIVMRVGEHNIHKWTSPLLEAARVLVHSDYKTMSADGDIALIMLTKDVEYTKFVRPICLWQRDASLDKIVGRSGTVVGWGKDEKNNLITPEPKQIQFPIVSQEDCLRSHFTFREITSERTFCAGYKNGSGPCNGDSGGGFAIEVDGRWYLRGIVSMSIAKDQTCDFSQYFVFADVTKFADWIQSTL